MIHVVSKEKSMHTMLKNLSEIGSEFWLEDITLDVVDNNDNGCYVLSGRTAIDVILQDIQKEHKKNLNSFM